MKAAAKGLQNLFQSSLTKQFNPYSQAIFSKLARCHTTEMGLHLYRCTDECCGHEHYQYHSCANRHCPNCGTIRKEQWVNDRMRELLPTSYYHVVFTLPHEFNSLIMGNRVELFKLLFNAASQTLLNHAKNPEFLGANPGIIAILHTWGQDLSFHPHVHCIVSAGGENHGMWVDAKRGNNKFLFPKYSLSKMYKGIFLEGIRKLDKKGILKTGGINPKGLITKSGYKRWNVYAKAPFGGPAQVMAYIGRYTHKVAITPHRIIAMDEGKVLFSYKDYADGNKQKQMVLSNEEFLRRFEQHFLPRRFVKIRYHGYLQNKGKYQRIEQIRESLALDPLKPRVVVSAAQYLLEKTGADITACPKCKTGKMELVAVYMNLKYNRSIDPNLYFENETQAQNKASPN